MQTLTEIKSLLAVRGLHPKHRLGQNFLHDKNQLAKLIDAAEVKAGDLILEVGPGTGTLTSALLERGAEIIACELDNDMAAIIREVFADSINEPGRPRPGPAPKHGSLTLIEGDCLGGKGGGARSVNPEIIAAIANRPFKLVANLPYQAASPLMSALLIEHNNCLGQFVTIQREVADRLRAKPSTKEYGPLSIIVQAMAEVKLISTLSPGCFWPQPDVTSAMVAINPLPRRDPLASSDHRRAFARFVVEMFSFRRKQLGTIWGRDRKDWPPRLSPQSRAEQLVVGELIGLWEWARMQRF